MSPGRARSKEPDEACAQAVDLARGAAGEMAGPGLVGEHLGVTADGDRVVTHRFSCLDPAYRGWCWAVTVARASRAKNVTIDETLLVPGPEAILAPDWVPWKERVLPGDLGVGDLLPAPPDDARLVPAASLEGDDGVSDWGETAWAMPGTEPEDLVPVPSVEPLAEGPYDDYDAEPEDLDGAETAAVVAVAMGADSTGADVARDDVLEDRPPRARVLSAIGRDDTALRWYTSEHGPKSPLANAAPGLCSGCGFLVRLGGPLGRVFGVCANEYAPDDGRVVSVDHGCGAHSEGVTAAAAGQPLRPVIDELGYDLVDMPGVSVEETVFEPLDHN
ncbi:MAG TPA: DUF3027 domain-containing protein [Streptosporangiaceae bacterium]|nr:DUF3027 domain-containing protein [Streptosporangiaceae bacterium]